ncbi:MAG: hypothetical protein LBP73_02320 [Clostridiales Family XIII bacterium]|jgi:hypothetical protein|nr:hypothetical protein [Clostridiales Family XIII bacterium]
MNGVDTTRNRTFVKHSRTFAIAVFSLIAVAVLAACASVSSEQTEDDSQASSDVSGFIDENAENAGGIAEAKTAEGDAKEISVTEELYFVTSETDAGINIRNSPSVSDGNKIFYVEAGDFGTRLLYQGKTRTVEENGETHDWFNVKIPDGNIGWVRDDVVVRCDRSVEADILGQWEGENADANLIVFNNHPGGFFQLCLQAPNADKSDFLTGQYFTIQEQQNGKSIIYKYESDGEMVLLLAKIENNDRISLIGPNADTTVLTRSSKNMDWDSSEASERSNGASQVSVIGKWHMWNGKNPLITYTFSESDCTVYSSGITNVFDYTLDGNELSVMWKSGPKEYIISGDCFYGKKSYLVMEIENGIFFMIPGKIYEFLDTGFFACYRSDSRALLYGGQYVRNGSIVFTDCDGTWYFDEPNQRIHQEVFIKKGKYDGTSFD